MNSSRERKDLMFLFFTISLFLVLYFPSLSYPPFSWDDRELILENPDILKCNGMAFWSLPYTGNYMPITMYVLGILYAGGKGWKAIRAAILLLHAINALLLFRLLKKISLHPFSVYASVVAFLFHPMQTEVLCWASETKTPLSFFFLLSGLLLLSKSPQDAKKMLPAFLLFVLSLLSKPVAVIFPVFAGYLFLRNQSLSRNAYLFLAISFTMALAFSFLTWYIQKGEGYISERISLPLAYRIPFSFYLSVLYLIHFLLPFRLSVFYPYPENLPGVILTGWLLMAGFIFLLFMWYRKGYTHLFYLLILSFVTLAPTLQWIPFGEAMMADRYAYLFIPFITLTIWEKIHSILSLKIQIFMLVIGGIMLAVLMHQRQKLWSNPVWIFTDAIKKYPAAYLAENSLGVEYMQKNMFELAEIHLRKAHELAPFSSGIKYNLALLMVKKGETENARIWLRKSTHPVHPYPKALNLWAELEHQKGNHALAMNLIQRSIRLRPDMARSWYVMGNLFMGKKEFDQAIASYEKAISLLPGIPEFYFRLGMALCQKGQYENGITFFDKAILLSPRDGEYYFWRAEALRKIKKEACPDYIRALRLGYPAAREVLKNGFCSVSSENK